MSESPLSRARAGDESAFLELVEPRRRELHLHCYRILGVAAGCRGHRAGDAARGLARAERLRGAGVAPHLAVPDCHESVPERAPRPEAPPAGGTFDARATHAHPNGRADVA